MEEWRTFKAKWPFQIKENKRKENKRKENNKNRKQKKMK